MDQYSVKNSAARANFFGGPKLLWQTTRRHLPILHTSDQIREVFRLPPLIAFCHPRNLRDLLVWAALTFMPHKPPGSYPVELPNVKLVPYWWPQTNFPAIVIWLSGKLFKVKTQTSYKSSNVIYLITCRRCGQQYVGETGQPFHLSMLRVNGHRFDIGLTSLLCQNTSTSGRTL